MSDSPLFLLGKLTAKFERLDDLLAEFMVNPPRSGIDPRWRDIQDAQRSIDAELERLAALYANPIQQIQSIAEEHRNKYLEVARELVNDSPEGQRRRTVQQLEDSLQQRGKQ